MTFRGHVRNGVVVLDPGQTLPEGAEVRIEFSTDSNDTSVLDEKGQTLGQKLLKYTGKAVGLPSDAAHNHDHYLYGTRKR